MFKCTIRLCGMYVTEELDKNNLFNLSYYKDRRLSFNLKEARNIILKHKCIHSNSGFSYQISKD